MPAGLLITSKIKTMKLRFLLLLPGLFLSLTVTAQSKRQARIDSLRTELQQVKEDTNKVKILTILSSQYWRLPKYDTALFYAYESLRLAQKLNFKEGIAGVYYNIGDIYHHTPDYPKSLKYYKLALKINEEIGDREIRADILGQTGFIYSRLSDYSNSLNCYLQALKINEQTGNKRNEASNLRNIAGIYSNLSNYSKALECNKKSIKD